MSGSTDGTPEEKPRPTRAEKAWLEIDVARLKIKEVGKFLQSIDEDLERAQAINEGGGPDG